MYFEFFMRSPSFLFPKVSLAIYNLTSLQFCSGQSLGCVQLFATPWTEALQASLSITNTRSLLKLMSIESVMPSNHLILCCPLLLPPSIFSSIRVFSNKSVLHTRWPKYWSFIRFLKFCNFQENLPNTNIQWTDFSLPFKFPFLGHSQLTLFRVSYVISFS